MQTSRRLLGATVLLSTALGGALAAAPTSAGADDGAGSGSDGTRIEATAAATGRVALAAERYDLTKAELRALLTEDRALRINPAGIAYFVDPAPAQKPEPTPVAEPAFPLSETFQLHSKEGSQRTIYLDFDGHTVADTYWNDIPDGIGVPDGPHPAWDPDFNGATFTDAEKLMIQDIWQRVAEDYAPFDVDVTTEEPDPSAIDRSGAGDQVYGTRALISPSDTALDVICGGGCGGVAFLNAFNMYPGLDPQFPSDTHAQLQPAWVFPQALGDDPKNIAEATTHEVGHNLGLEHDATSTEGYYTGHNGWAPIMGVGYEQPVVQWALNDYPDGRLGGPEGGGDFQTNPDDVVTIVNHGVAERADEPGSTVGNAGPVPDTGYVSSRTDVDVYALGSCTGPLTVAANGAEVSPNLDIKLELLDTGGSAVDTDDPVSAPDPFDRDLSSGLDAEVSIGSASGNYFVRIDGVGRGSATTGYTDYGSLGAYTLDVTGNCTASEPPDDTAPSAPQNLAGSYAGSGQVNLSWSPPASDGGAAVSGYRVYEDGVLVRQLAASATSVQLTGVAPGVHQYGVAAVNSVGEGPRAQVSVDATDTVEESKPGRPQIGQAVPGARGGDRSVIISWQPPVTEANPAIDGYRIVVFKQRRDGRYVKLGTTDLVPTEWSTGTEVGPLPKGKYKLAVQAHNALGFGKPSAKSNAVKAR